MHTRRGFTLIELLVVIAIIAILSVVVILTLNPADLLRQSRDTNRLSDLATINTALGLFQTDINASALGTASTTYLSIPDPSATSSAGDQCQGLGFPALPTGSSYHCASSSTYRNTDGMGWIPANFKLISSGNPFATLPVDPTNTTSGNFYYAYTPGATTWELDTQMEASKNTGTNSVSSNDGGNAKKMYELGTNLTLTPTVIDLRRNLKFVNYGSAVYANVAEAYCSATYGPKYHLYVPRNSADIPQSYVLSGSSSAYFTIMGIYPKVVGNTCVNIPVNYGTCSGWRATDDGDFYTTGLTSLTEPNGDNCATGSMGYVLSGGVVASYNDLSCPGYNATNFICADD
jgi:prepilin-type N-terminal cleavage/methylation domain-containing protein